MLQDIGVRAIRYAGLAPGLMTHGCSESTSATIEEARTRVWDLHVRGLQPDAIAEVTGYRPARVTQALHAGARVRRRSWTRADVEHARELELSRLDSMLSAWWQAGAGGTDVYAAPIILRIVELRSKLLGLDKPPAPAELSDRPLAALSDADLLARVQAAADRLIPAADTPLDA
jgi:hypothetical protein